MLLSSCVGNKKLVILQNQSLKKPQEQTYSHQFDAPPTALLLAPGDVVSVVISHYDLSASAQQLDDGGSTAPASMAAPYSNGYRIGPDGTLSHPTLGDITAAGLTVHALEAALKERAGERYAKAHIKVTLLSFEVTVLGEVSNPGTYAMHQENSGMLKALGMAGGPSSMADLERIKVVRTRGNKTNVFFLDLTNEQVLKSPEYLLRPNDVVYVKPLKRKIFTLQETQYIFRGLGVIISITSLGVAVSRL